MTLAGVCLLGLTSAHTTTEASTDEINLQELLDQGKTVPNLYGVNIRWYDNEKGMNACESVGAKWIRMDMAWHKQETVKGEIDFSQIDKLMSDAKARDLGVVAILDYTNPLYEPHGQRKIVTDEGRAGFTHFSTELVKRYKDQKVVWEIWNEPNNAGFWKGNDPAEYMALIKVVCPAIREVDPDAIIAGPSIYKTFSKDFMKYCFKNGLLDYVDVFSFHPYRRNRPEDVLLDMDIIHELMTPYLKDGQTPPPIMNSEWGFPSTRYGELGAAIRVPRQMLLSIMLDFPISIYFDIMNAGSSPTNSEHRYGLHTAHPYYVPRQTGSAYMATLRVLDGYQFSRRIVPEGTDDPDLFLLEFVKGDEKIYAHWAGKEDDAATIDWRFPQDLGAVRKITMFGQRLSGDLLPGDQMTSTTSVEYLVPLTEDQLQGNWSVKAQIEPTTQAGYLPWAEMLGQGGPGQGDVECEQNTNLIKIAGMRDLQTGAIDFWIKVSKEDYGKTLISGGDLKKPFNTLKIALDADGNITATHWAWPKKGWYPELSSQFPVDTDTWIRVTYQIGSEGRRLFINGQPLDRDLAQSERQAYSFQYRAEPKLSSEIGFLQVISGKGFRP